MRYPVASAAAVLMLVGSPSFAGAGPTPVRGPVTVFLAARTGQAAVTPEEIALRKENLKAAKAAMDQVSASLVQKHGKSDKWPPEAMDQFYEAFYKTRMVATSIWCANVSDKDLTDALNDFRGSVASRAKKGWLQVVDIREQADLIIEVLGRSTEVRTLGDLLFQKASFLGGSRVVTYDVLPGRIDANTLAKLPGLWPRQLAGAEGATITADHWFTPADPFFRLSVGDNQRWGLVAATASFVLDDMVKVNYALLKPER